MKQGKKHMKSMLLFLALALVITLLPANTVTVHAAAGKKLSKPTISSVKAKNTTSIAITWKKSKNAKKYEVWTATDKSFKKNKKTKKSTTASVTITGRKANTRYYVKVRAVNGKKYSSWSSVKTVTTPKTSYTIKYNLNGGKNNSANPSKYKYGKTVALKSPTKSGYTFTGWFTDSKLTKKFAGIKKTTKGNLTLYAGWKKNVQNRPEYGEITMDTASGGTPAEVLPDYDPNHDCAKDGHAWIFNYVDYDRRYIAGCGADITDIVMTYKADGNGEWILLGDDPDWGGIPCPVCGKYCGTYSTREPDSNPHGYTICAYCCKLYYPHVTQE